MTPPLKAAELPDAVYRIGRYPDPWDWPDWAFVGDDGTFGNRFDDPEGEYRVLYAATQREATFRECLARFRPDPTIVAAVIEEDDADDDATATAPPGEVPADWLGKRRMGTGRLQGVFCDVGHSDSLDHMREHLAGLLLHHGLDDLDAGDIRARAPRRFTQELGRYIFALSTPDGAAAFAGVRYGSRLGDQLTNWAIFEGNDIADPNSEPLEPGDPDLLRVLEAYNLTLLEE